MGWLGNLWADVKKDEAWVVSEIQKGWQLVNQVEQTAEVDVLAVFQWISDHHAELQKAIQTALEGITIAGAVAPQVAPFVPAAVAAGDAAQALIDKLAENITKGTTPVSTLQNAYVLVNEAVAAAKPLLSAATSSAASPK